MYSISRGASPKPLKCVVYGAEGVGKTTFAAQWPGAVFIDVEDGSGHYDVARMPRPQTWGELLDEITWCAMSPDVGTVVVDTADAAEALCIAHILDENQWTSIESPGYGKGFTVMAEEFRKLTAALDGCVANGKNALLVAHAQIKKFEQPDEMGAYDRWELKLSKKCAPIVKEWCDLLLFANYKTDLVKDESGKYRPSGGKRRVMYASHTAAYDAKNRLGLADELPFEFAAIADKVTAFATGGIVEQPVIAQPEPSGAVAMQESAADLSKLTYTDATPPEVKSLWELMDMDGITKEQVMRAVGEGQNNPYTVETTIGEYDPVFIRDVLVAHWGQIAGGIKERAAYEAPVPFD